MPDNTGIEWTDATWNPVTGCTKVSPGCAHCYAEAITLRFKRGGPFLPGKTTIRLHPDRLDQPSKWRRPRRIFVNSMSDLFHEGVPFEFVDDIFEVMAANPRHTYQVLTKRPERMLDYVEWTHWREWPVQVWARRLGRESVLGRPPRSAATASPSFDSLPVLRAVAKAVGARPKWHSLGHRRRRKRPPGEEDGGGLGGRYPEAMPEGPGCVLFQTMGRAKQQGRRAHGCLNVNGAKPPTLSNL